MAMESEVRDRLMSDQKGPFALLCTALAPYDGCWHEPNYWLVKDHKVYPLYISGEAWDLFQFSNYDTPWMHGTHFMTFLRKMEESSRYEDWGLIEVEDWELDNYNILNSVTVIMMLHQVTSPKWKCGICWKTCRGRAKFLGYRGNGGVGVFLEDPCCSSCFSNIKWCDTCCSTVSVDEYGNCPNDNDDDGYHELTNVEDEAEQFGLTGMKFLGPDGDAEGLEGVSIVVMTKGG